MWTHQFLVTVCIYVVIGILPLNAQSFIKDFSYHMRIPEIIQMSSTEIHAYVLSSRDGLIVFRTHKDSLQWLFTIENAQERGNTLQSDIRFAYLYGNSNQIHIIEPTSLLGIYSVADVGFEPNDITRVQEKLYIAGKNGEFGQLDLSNPDTVVSSFKPIEIKSIPAGSVLEIEAFKQHLCVLTNQDSLFILDPSIKPLKIKQKIALNQSVSHLMATTESLFGSNEIGDLFEINLSEGTTKLIAKLTGVPTQLAKIDSILVVRNHSNVVQAILKDSVISISHNSEAGNHIIASKNTLWMSEYADLVRMIFVNKTSDVTSTSTTTQTQVSWKLKPVSNQIIPYPKPVIVHLETEPRSVENSLIYTIISPFPSITQKANNFYWQPTARDIGVHLFKVIASDALGNLDSTSFTVDIRAFNLPPKFAPFRPVSLPVSEVFTVQFSAIDPDGMEPNLIRYVGLDLPTGAQLNEKTGFFEWTPSLQQVGIHEFRIIATDQYGTASSLDVKMTVLDIKRGEN